MTRWLVTLVSLTGVITAVLIVVRNGTRTLSLPERPQDEPTGGPAGALRAVRAASVAIVSGAISMALVGGLGGRLLMRVAAATSSDQAQGLLTDADEIVGEVTIGGTLGLVVFITLFAGGAIGLFYCLLRPFLPGPARLAGLVPIVIVTGMFGRVSEFTNPDNKDFAILEPQLLIAAMLMALIVLFGMTLGATYEWLNTKVPSLRRDPKALVWYLPLAPMALMPLNLAAIGVSGIVGAVMPEGPRDSVRRTQTRRVVGGIVAGITAVAALRVLTDVASIAF